MPSLLRTAARLLPVVVALALAVACSLAFAARPANIEVAITKPNGTQATLTTGEVSNPEIDTNYTVRQPGGATTTVKVQDGISIRQLLAEAEAELGYAKLEIPKPGGGVVTLTQRQVDAASPPPPVLFADETGATWFLRSPTSSTDVNSGDYFKIPTSAISIKQSGAVVTVKVKASRTKIDAGESVRFTASVSDGPDDADYTYDWVFDDGKKAIDGGKSISHEFAKEGSFVVVVGVHVNGAGRTDSDSVRIEVGEPQDSDKNREGGGDNGAAGAPSSGTSTGTSGAGSSTGTSTPYTPSYTPPPSTPSTPPAPSTTPPKTPGIATDGTPVEGNLLADVTDPPASNILESARRAARDGEPSDDSKGTGVSEAAVSIVGVLALLGLGAGIESRQGRLPRPRLPRLPRRAA